MERETDRLANNHESAKANVPYYDTVWPTFEPDYTCTNRINFITDSIADLAHAHRPLRILDLGCGMGWMAKHLSAFGQVTGVDYSPVGIKRAKEQFGAFGSFQVIDPASPTLGLPSNAAFDVVVASEVIEHVHHPESFLQTISRLLASGGIVVLTTPNGNLWEHYRSDARFKGDIQPVENWLSAGEMFQLLTGAGFRLLRHEGGPVFTLRYGVTRPLQHPGLMKVFDLVGARRLFRWLVRHDALYQFFVAQKAT